MSIGSPSMIQIDVYKELEEQVCILLLYSNPNFVSKHRTIVHHCIPLYTFV